MAHTKYLIAETSLVRTQLTAFFFPYQFIGTFSQLTRGGEERGGAGGEARRGMEGWGGRGWEDLTGCRSGKGGEGRE